MSVAVYWEGTEITDYLVSYRRDDNLCDSKSLIEVVLTLNCPYSFDFYDTITLYEDGNKKGTYKINNKGKDYPKGTQSISGTNSQINLENHFITEKYLISETPTYKTRYWIEKFLTEASVSYSITESGDGEYLPDDLVLGANIASSEVQRLLQFSGWYMRYDENGQAIVGKIDYDASYFNVTVDDSTILNIGVTENDQLLRNRSVVWGMGTGDDPSGWVFADISTQTPWNYDSNDKRAVLISNSYISDVESAYTIASTVLKEFTKPNVVKVVKVAGFVNTHVADRIYLSSKFISTTGVVTSLGVSFEDNGYVTYITLDERCPRMIGYFNYGGYVYIGTDGEGVWRKPLKYDHTWENFSTGLGDLHIKELHIYNGKYVAVTSGGYLYIRYPSDTQWNLFAGTGICSTATIDRWTNDIIAGFNTYDPGPVDGQYSINSSGIGLIYRINSPSYYTYTPVWISGYYTVSGINYGAALLGMDNDGRDTYITSYLIPSGSGAYYRVQNQYQLDSVDMFESVTGSSDFYAASHITSGTVQKKVMSYNMGDRYVYGDYVFRIGNDASSTFDKYDIITDTLTASVSASGPSIPHDSQSLYDENTAYAVGYTTDYSTYSLYVLEKIDFITESITTVDSNFIYTTGYYTTEYVNPMGTWIIDDNLIYLYEHYYIDEFDVYTYNLCYKVYNILTGVTSTEHTIWSKNPDYFGITGEEGYPSAILNGKLYLLVYYYDYNTNNSYTDVVILDANGSFTHTNTGRVSVHSSYTEDHYRYYMMPSTDTNLVYFVYKDVSGSWQYASVDSSGNITDISDLSAGLPDYGYPLRLLYSNSRRFFLVTNFSSGNTEIYDESLNYVSEIDDAHTGYFYASIDSRLDETDGSFLYKASGGYRGIIRRFNIDTLEDTLVYTTVSGDMSSSYLKPRVIGQFIHSGSNLVLYAENPPEPSGGGQAGFALPKILKFSRTNKLDSVGTWLIDNHHVEASQEYPVIFYGGDDYWNSGSMQFGIQSLDGGLELKEVTLSYEGATGLIGDNFVSDARSFYVNSTAGMYNRTVFVTRTFVEGSGYVRLLDYTEDLVDPEQWTINGYQTTNEYIGFSGIVTHLETTNYAGDHQYFFVTISGGFGQTFFQRDKYDLGEAEAAFEERNANLPSSEITVIRCDDRV